MSEVEIVLPTGELLQYRPVSAVELEFIIRQLGDRLEASVPLLDQLQRARYDAEEAYSKAFETAKATGKQALYSDRRSHAILACLPLMRELNEAKAKLHHAENLQDAVKSKLIGYENINRVNGAAYGAGGVGR